MSRAIFFSAARGLWRNPVRSSMVVLCLTALLFPFVTGVAICEGIKQQYRAVLKAGADIYVTRDGYGSNAPIELSMIEELQQIPGVTRIVPRVIGRTYAKGIFLAVLGISPDSIPTEIQVTEGRRPREKGEAVMGRNAAGYLDFDIGSRFSVKRNPEHVLKIVGLFHSPFAIWDSDLLVMNHEDASELFCKGGMATDLMVFTRPGYERVVDTIIHALEDRDKAGSSPIRVQTRDLIDRYSSRGFNVKAGVFTGFYCLVFGLGIPAVGVISGFGLTERKREIGVMKATGWQTQEVLEMVAAENLILSVMSIPPIVSLAALWIHVFNGAGISRVFIASIDILIPFSIPSRIFPIPFLLGGLMALVLTNVGSIYSTWKTAIVPPVEAMKS